MLSTASRLSIYSPKNPHVSSPALPAGQCYRNLTYHKYNRAVAIIRNKPGTGERGKFHPSLAYFLIYLDICPLKTQAMSLPVSERHNTYAHTKSIPHSSALKPFPRVGRLAPTMRQKSETQRGGSRDKEERKRKLWSCGKGL